MLTSPQEESYPWNKTESRRLAGRVRIPGEPSADPRQEDRTSAGSLPIDGHVIAQRARLLEPTLSAGEREIGARAATPLNEYFLPIIEERRADPRDDIISALAQAEEAGDRLTEREMLTLLRNPDQLQALRDDPGLIPSAAEELLRFDSPVQTIVSCTRCAIPSSIRDPWTPISGQPHSRGSPSRPPATLCLCKIHHAAYDNDLIGISPDYAVRVRPDVREETDGPMLLHGLQELHDSTVVLPGRRADRPDRDRLAWRYERFRAA